MTNPTYRVIGDPLTTAFTKINNNFVGLSNAPTTLAMTNAGLPKLTNGVLTLVTNATGTVTITNYSGNAGAVVGSGSSFGIGTNSTASGIATQGGSGTNTTLVSAISINTTNLAVAGTTWLNNSNLTISGIFSQTNGSIIPLMTFSNAPSGYAFSDTNSSNAYSCFSGSSSHAWFSGAVAGITNYVQYNFDSPITISAMDYCVLTYFYNTNTCLFQGSADGSAWTNLSTNVGHWEIYFSNYFNITHHLLKNDENEMSKNNFRKLNTLFSKECELYGYDLKTYISKTLI